MGQPTEKKHTGVRSDRFELDFGKNAFQIDEKARISESLKRKLPPVPQPVPPATSVPLSEVLNRKPERRKE